MNSLFDNWWRIFYEELRIQGPDGERLSEEELDRAADLEERGASPIYAVQIIEAERIAA